MKTRTLETEMWLPLGIDAVFGFFSDAQNLDAITPPWLHFRILTPTPLALSAGAFIDYRIRVHGVPVTWKTEITAWQPPFHFVDEQRKGPYRVWIHRHDFVERDGGTWIRDRVSYVAPGFVCEPLLHRLLVGPDLRAIFAFRQRKIRATLAPGTPPVEDKIELK